MRRTSKGQEAVHARSERQVWCPPSAKPACSGTHYTLMETTGRPPRAGPSSLPEVEALAKAHQQLRSEDQRALQPLPFPSGEPGPDAGTVRAHLQKLHSCTEALLARALAAAHECEQLRQLVQAQSNSQHQA